MVATKTFYHQNTAMERHERVSYFTTHKKIEAKGENEDVQLVKQISTTLRFIRMLLK